MAVDMYTKKLAKTCNCPFRTYKLIIMDIGMPVMDGKQASKIILSKMMK